jgi:hypothetical protein
MIESLTVGVQGGSPTGANTIILFDSYKMLQGAPLALYGLDRLVFGVKNDQAFTLQLFMAADSTLSSGSPIYSQVGGDRAVPIPAASDISGPYDYPISGYFAVQLKVVNGGVSQGTWRPFIRLEANKRAPQT